MPDTSHIRALCERIGSLLSLRGELRSAVLALSDALEQDSMLPEETSASAARSPTFPAPSPKS